MLPFQRLPTEGTLSAAAGRTHRKQMLKQDIIVVGASAGGVEALTVLAAGLPADLQAPVFMVLHTGSGVNRKRYLAEILSKAGPLSAVNPRTGDPIEKGKIYVAPPDSHLIIEPSYIRLSSGPKENRARPAINPLFRSAARAYNGRVTGVIMTGMLDDGVAGLAEVKRMGGVAIVEDPKTARYPSMPANALKHVAVDYVAALPMIATLVAALASSGRGVEKREVIESDFHT
jgi:two-component system chemotaxis response regulator CheB